MAVISVVHQKILNAMADAVSGMSQIGIRHCPHLAKITVAPRRVHPSAKCEAQHRAAADVAWPCPGPACDPTASVAGNIQNAYESTFVPLEFPESSSRFKKVIHFSGFSVSPKITTALAVPQQHPMLADTDPPAVGAENLRF